MSLLFMDSFSDGTLKKWNPGSVGSYYSSSPRLSGGYYIQLSWGDGITKYFTSASKVILGFGLNPGSRDMRIALGGDGTRHITIHRLGASGLMEIRRGTEDGTVVATGTTVIPQGQWCYLEISATISDTVGEVHIRLNGASFDELSYVGDTKNGGTGTTVDYVRFENEFNTNHYLSDVYICDDTGSTNNAFLGDVAVRELRPNGNGNSSLLTGSDADQIDNYLHVDEAPYTSADYTGSNTTGDKDTYTMTDLPADTSTVCAVQVSGLIFKSDAGTAQSRLLLRSGGTDYGADTQVLATNSQLFSKIYEQDPATATDWTVSGVNSAEAGMEVM